MDHPFLVLTGRILFTLIFFFAMPRHFTSEGIQHAAARGTPFAKLFVPLSGVIGFAGALSVLLGFRPQIGGVLILIFLIPITIIMHPFWKFSNPIDIHVQKAMFAKNVSMIGAILFIIYFGTGPLSITN